MKKVSNRNMEPQLEFAPPYAIFFMANLEQFETFENKKDLVEVYR